MLHKLPFAPLRLMPSEKYQILGFEVWSRSTSGSLYWGATSCPFRQSIPRPQGVFEKAPFPHLLSQWRSPWLGWVARYLPRRSLARRISRLPYKTFQVPAKTKISRNRLARRALSALHMATSRLWLNGSFEHELILWSSQPSTFAWTDRLSFHCLTSKRVCILHRFMLPYS